MQNNSKDILLRLLGNCILVIITFYIIINNNWGYIFFIDFLQNLKIIREIIYPLLYLPTIKSIGNSVLFAHVFNSILVVLTTSVFIISSYKIANGIKFISNKISFKQHAVIVCVLVFIISSSIIVCWAIGLYNVILQLEEFSNVPINSGVPFMTNYLPCLSTLWYSIVPYFILNFVRVIIAGFVAMFAHALNRN